MPHQFRRNVGCAYFPAGCGAAIYAKPVVEWTGGGVPFADKQTEKLHVLRSETMAHAARDSAPGAELRDGKLEAVRMCLNGSGWASGERGNLEKSAERST